MENALWWQLLLKGKRIDIDTMGFHFFFYLIFIFFFKVSLF